MENGQPTTGSSSSNVISGWARFLEDTWAELHRVQWPSRELVIKHTVIVVSVLIFMALYIGGWDFIWTQAFKYILHVREY